MAEERRESESAAGATGTSETTSGTLSSKAKHYERTVAGAATEAADYIREHIAADAATIERYNQADEEDELSKAVEEAIEDVERARVMMQRDQAEIEQLKEETRRMISRLLAA